MNFQMIPVADMKVDSTYQRPADNKRVDKIANNWDDMKANLIHVSHRADGYYVIDGNHTRLAFMKVGGEQMPCRVYEGLSVEEEARLFYELNNSQKKPTYNEVLKAKVAAGCEFEKSYFRLLDDADIQYTFTNCRGPKIKCHAALINVYKITTYHLMLRALKVAKRAANDRDVFYQTGYFPGLCSLVVLHPDVDDMRLIDKIRTTTSSKIKDRANMYTRSAISGSSGATSSFRKAYIDFYNSGLRKNKIEE